MTRYMTLAVGCISAVVVALIFVSFYPYVFDSEQATYHQQCIDRYTGNNSNLASSFGLVSCSFGPQYPAPLPDPYRNITIKNTQILWLGDCKILTDTGELLHGTDDVICMASPGDSMWVYQHRIRPENTLTNLVTVNP